MDGEVYNHTATPTISDCMISNSIASRAARGGGLGDVLGSPAFLDPGTGDCHTGPNSAAIDARLNAGVFTEIDGQSRPWDGLFDLGADEAYWWFANLAPAVKSAP